MANSRPEANEEELRKRRENMQRRSDSQAAAGFEVLYRPDDGEAPADEEDSSHNHWADGRNPSRQNPVWTASPASSHHSALFAQRELLFMKKLVPVVGLLLLATSHASSQTLNRCVDAEGNVSFSDVACDESQASEQVDVMPNDPVTSRAGKPPQEDRSAVSASGETPTQERLKRRSEELLEEALTVLDQPRTRRATGNQGGKHRHGRRLQRASNMLAEGARSGINDEQMEEGLELIDRAVEKSNRYSRGRDGRKRSRHEQQAQSLLNQAASVMDTVPSRASVQTGGAGSETTPEPGGQVIDGAGHLPPPGPVTITNCDSTGCWGSDGERYNSTDGQTFFRGSGGTCHRQGNMMHCP